MSRIASFLGGRRGTILAGVAGLAIGGTVGSAVALEVRHPVVMAPVSITRIAALGSLQQSWPAETVASVRGKVVEMFGDRLVLDDGSGRTLVDLGHAPSGLVAQGQTITVQGRAETNGLHAHFVVAADGHVVALHGPGPGHGEGRRGHDRDHRPGDRPGDDQAPPAPPAAPAAPTN